MSRPSVSALGGIVPAVLTPVDADGVFRPGPFPELVGRLVAAGVDGIYVLGYSGEGFQQPVEQRRKIAEAAIRAMPADRAVIVHVGGGSVNDTLALARHAREIGARAVASLPPPGIDGPGDEIAFFARLVEAAQLPVLLYYLPGVCGKRSLRQLLAICAVPGVAGLKYSDSDVHDISVLARRGHVVFNGVDEVFAAGLLMGASGGVGGFYNAIPEAFVTLWRAAQAGDWEKARDVQQDVNAFVEAVQPFPLIPAFKAIARWSGIDCGPPIAPRRPLDAEQERSLREALSATRLGAALLAHA